MRGILTNFGRERKVISQGPSAKDRPSRNRHFHLINCKLVASGLSRYSGYGFVAMRPILSARTPTSTAINLN